MKIALLADLHANREAVCAVLAHAADLGVDRHVFLGDFVGYGADPAWVVDLVREHVDRGALAIMGNHDIAVVQGPSPKMRPTPRLSIEWTRAQLSAEQIDFLSRLPMTLEEDDRLYVHASANAPGHWEYVLGPVEAAMSLRATTKRHTFVGHVHTPMLYQWTSRGQVGVFMPTPGVTMKLLPQQRWLAIVGSAGQPRDGNPAACYATFDTDREAITWHRVPYDHEAAAEKVRASGLPPDLAERLRRGD